MINNEKKNYKFKDINFTPVENRVVVKLGKLFTWPQKQVLPDPELNKGKDLTKEEAVLGKPEIVNVKYNYQFAEVVGVSEKDTNFHVGDKVLVDVRNLRELDLYKDIYWVWRADIHGIVNAG